MHLRVLGSGTCELRAARSSPAHLVKAGGTRLLLDCGQGAWRRLLEAGEEPAGLSAIVLSHAHLDHTADLIPLLFALNYDPVMREQARLRLLAHRGFNEYLAGLQQVFGDWLQVTPPRLTPTWLEPGDRVQVGQVSLSCAAALHSPVSLAFRLEHEGADLVYLGDSEATGDLARFAAGAELLMVDCAASDREPKKGHIGPTAAGRLAAAAGAGALLLSHLYRDVEPDEAVAAASRVFSGPVWAAQDHLRLELKPGRACLA